MLRMMLSAISSSRDYKLRKFLKKTLYGAGVPRIEIERDAAKVRIHIHCARPGMVIGRGGADIEKLRQQCEKMINKGKETPVAVLINIVEVKQADKNAQLVAESIATQLERRVSLPPCDEAGHRPCDEAGRQGHQGECFRPFGRSGDRA